MSAEIENIVYKKPKMNFLGCPYPIVKNPQGFLYTQSGLKQIKSDLLTLLLTNPGERCMLPEFGTPLRKLIFEQGDYITEDAIRSTIINSIKRWEPRISVSAISVAIGSNIDETQLEAKNFAAEKENIAFIKIIYSEFNNLQEVEELNLQLPLAGE